jgi:hypothetical protein
MQTEQTDRRPYQSQNGNSGVSFYALGPSSISVWFHEGRGYVYDSRRPGKLHVDEMKRLAEEGRGLTTYINKHVRKNFARKL